MDEVTLYNRALPSNEIAAVYGAGVGGKCKEVIITSPPQSQNALLGGNASFSVAATGFGTLRYRRLFNGAALANATNSVLLLTNVQPAPAGNYSVAASNTLGSITSAVAVLSVSTPPAVTNQPQDQTVTVGAGASFMFGADGTAPLSYQWRKAGLLLPGQTAASLVIPTFTVGDAGEYDVVVTNLVGAVTSGPPAVLTVVAPPFITLAPANQTVTAGADASFNVVAGRTPPLLISGAEAGCHSRARPSRC